MSTLTLLKDGTFFLFEIPLDDISSKVLRIALRIPDGFGSDLLPREKDGVHVTFRLMHENEVGDFKRVNKNIDYSSSICSVCNTPIRIKLFYTELGFNRIKVGNIDNGIVIDTVFNTAVLERLPVTAGVVCLWEFFEYTVVLKKELGVESWIPDGKEAFLMGYQMVNYFSDNRVLTFTSLGRIFETFSQFKCPELKFFETNGLDIDTLPSFFQGNSIKTTFTNIHSPLCNQGLKPIVSHFNQGIVWRSMLPDYRKNQYYALRHLRYVNRRVFDREREKCRQSEDRFQQILKIRKIEQNLEDILEGKSEDLKLNIN